MFVWCFMIKKQGKNLFMRISLCQNKQLLPLLAEWKLECQRF